MLYQDWYDPRHCIICGQCKNPSNRVFRVPKNESKRQLWSETCGRVLQQRNFICSRHFTPEDMGSKKLKGGALPRLRLHHPKAIKTDELMIEEEDSYEQSIHERNIQDDNQQYEVKIEKDESDDSNDANTETIYIKIEKDDAYQEEVDKAQQSEMCDQKVEQSQAADSKEVLTDSGIGYHFMFDK